MTRLIGMGEVARRIGLRPATLRNRFLNGSLEDFAIRAPNGARMFTEADVERLRAAMENGRPEAA